MSTTEQDLKAATPQYWRVLSGPVLTVFAVGIFEILAHAGYRIPNPPAVFLLIVAFSAFYGGMRSGLVSAVLAWLYTWRAQ